MGLQNKWASDLLSKDKQKAQAAIAHILNTPDHEAWECLMESSDYIFSYIKDRIGQNIAANINNTNIENVFSLLKYHSADWDYYIAEGLKNNSSDIINTRLLDLLSSGTAEEKSYAAKYFSLAGSDNAKNALFAAAREDYEPLRNNAAEALGKLNDLESYNYFLNQLESDDDWEKVQAAEFLSRYGNKDAVIPILRAMTNSGMAEYIAGEVGNLVSFYELLENDDEETQLLVLEALDNIISSMPEIWGLASLLDFQIYECLDKLVQLATANPEGNMSGKYAQILLKSKSKISLFVENSQYTFDEEKTVLGELEEISQLLLGQSEEFWYKQQDSINKELKADSIKRKLAAVNIINEMEILSSVDNLINLVSSGSESEIVLCEAILTLSKLGKISEIPDLNAITARVEDQNLLAMIKNSIPV